MDRNDNTIRWLLEPDDPSVRFFTLLELLDEPLSSPEVIDTQKKIPDATRVRSLLDGQQDDGGFGVHPYKKWNGAHWRLVSLVELGFPPGDPRVNAAVDQVLHWLLGKTHRSRIRKINGLTRRCASQEGNALAVCSRLDLADDSRVERLASSLVEWQWPDGGWNCYKNLDAHHSSFHESLIPLWGLIEYHKATNDHDSLKAANQTAEFFLQHSLFRSDRTGEIINPQWLKLRYPAYWHYDILQALRILSLLGKLNDPRTHEALGMIESKRLSNGRWRAEGYWWRPPGKPGYNVEVADWGRRGPNKMITLNALHVLKSAGRI